MVTKDDKEQEETSNKCSCTVDGSGARSRIDVCVPDG